MAQSRLELQGVLEAIPGVVRVYFQPPEGLQMEYPCIVYERDNRLTHHADNRPFYIDTRYLVTIIDVEADSTIPEAVAQLPTATFNRFFAVDNLNHDVYTLYF